MCVVDDLRCFDDGRRLSRATHGVRLIAYFHQILWSFKLGGHRIRPKSAKWRGKILSLPVSVLRFCACLLLTSFYYGLGWIAPSIPRLVLKGVVMISHPDIFGTVTWTPSLVFSFRTVKGGTWLNYVEQSKEKRASTSNQHRQQVIARTHNKRWPHKGTRHNFFQPTRDFDSVGRISSHSSSRIATTIMIGRTLLLLTALYTVSAFTTVAPLAGGPPRSVTINGQHQSVTFRRRPDLLRASTAATGENNKTVSVAGGLTDKILRQLEKEEAKMTKARQDAMEKLNRVELSLSQLQSKKQEYLNGGTLGQIPAGTRFSETAVRSAVKAFTWRVIAGAVTFVTSLGFSGSIGTALSIVGSDFFSKSFTMFIGERLMNKSQAGRQSGADDARRSLAKALLWRLFAVVNTLTMAIFISKNLSVASKIAGSDAIFKTALMFFYERVWAKIEWGKEYQVEFSI